MTNSILRAVIKVVITLIILGIMTAARGSVPAFIRMLLGLGAITAVWRYKPEPDNTNDNDPKLNK
jgi:hypothetical protein